jgi:hypothetical protein
MFVDAHRQPPAMPSESGGCAGQSIHPFGGRALYERFVPQEARRVLRQLEFHYVPTHASRLNMVEIEIGVLRAQCLGIAEPDELVTEIAAWQQRNGSG